MASRNRIILLSSQFRFTSTAGSLNVYFKQQHKVAETEIFFALSSGTKLLQMPVSIETGLALKPVIYADIMYHLLSLL